MARPQRLGIIPTWWFWRELRWDYPLLCGLINTSIGALTVALGWFMTAAGFGLPAVLLAASLVPLLGLGVTERLLRRLVVRRRRALAAGRAERAPASDDNEPPRAR